MARFKASFVADFASFLKILQYLVSSLWFKPHELIMFSQKSFHPTIHKRFYVLRSEVTVNDIRRQTKLVFMDSPFEPTITIFRFVKKALDECKFPFFFQSFYLHLDQYRSFPTHSFVFSWFLPSRRTKLFLKFRLGPNSLLPNTLNNFCGHKSGSIIKHLFSL